MDNTQLKPLITKGLAAMQAGCEVAKQGTDEIQQDATNEQLQAALKQGEETSKQWRERIDQCMQEAGGEVENESNDILEAHYRVSKEIRQRAEDDQSRDLGIIAAGQMALHYWIASFGTMHAYTRQLGMTKSADLMKQCMQEAKDADEAHTEIAFEIMGAKQPSMA